MSEVPFMGHLLTADGLITDPNKVHAIKDMPTPTDVKSLKRFLGMVNYVSKFLPNLSSVSEPLRRLEVKDAEWCWLPVHNEAVQKIKGLVCEAPVLKFYDVTREVTVESDVSLSGLGATLLQEGQPVAFASRALTPAEGRYAQIEKELLSVVFACERFDTYLFGRDIVHEKTDHQPFETIFKKDLSSAPKQLQRMLLRLQRYNLDVKYQKGEKSYLSCRADITVQNGLLFKGERIIVPSQLRKEMMEKIHSSHLGIEGCLRRAREVFYWPRMNAELKDFILKCDVCNSFKPQQTQEPLMPHEIPTRPWQKVGTDLMQFDGRQYLIIVDYFSSFFEVDKLETTDSRTVVEKLKMQFSRHGIPEIVVSDNGPQYNSCEFKTFAEDWNFQHINSSPRNPQSNGRWRVQ